VGGERRGEEQNQKWREIWRGGNTCFCLDLNTLIFNVVFIIEKYNFKLSSIKIHPLVQPDTAFCKPSLLIPFSLLTKQIVIVEII